MSMRARGRSNDLFQKASRLMPGGVSSPVRAFRSVGGTPVFFARAAGSRIWDEDGNQYVDFCMSWGPLILGHAHPAVVEAVCRAAGNGLSFGACCALEAELAELVLSAFPGMDQLRFTSSGTEAVMTAIRLARGVTGRSRILKFEGGYHGHSDSLLVKAGSGLVTFGTSSSKGVPEVLAAETVVLPFDDISALEGLFTELGETLAAGGRDRTLVYALGKIFDAGEGGENLGAQFRRRCDGRTTQPVMADHAFFVGISDGTAFEFGHGGEGLLHAWLHRGEEIVRERDAADVEREAEIAVLVKVFFET